jgi:3-oxoacyl-[acyl-carrier protein] reductase
MDLHLQDKVALVTGGSRGLGRAICLALAAEGVKVAINYRRGERDARELSEVIRSTHATDTCLAKADVSDSGQVAQMFDTCSAQLGGVDVLVNNAGVWPTAFVKDMSEQDWDRTQAVNLRSVFLTCREAVRRWETAGSKGRIVNVSSAVAFLGSTTGHAHYAAAKAAVVNFTISLAREVASLGIYVNAVAPGMMRTEMAREALEENEAAYLRRIPLGRIAEASEVADAVLYLASDRASYTTGATWDVSGGMLMR